MSNKFFSTSIRPIFVWAFLIAVVASCLWFISLKYIEWQYLASQPGTLERLKAENGNLTTIAQICGGLFLLVGLCFTGWNALIARRNMEIAQRNMRIAEDGKITDRFSKAVEQLGNDKLEIRLGGIYALERIAIDSEKDHPQVMEVLTAFVRDNSFLRKNEVHVPLTQKEKLDTDIQAILSVIGRRNSDHIKIEKWVIDLRNTHLTNAFLQEADLAGAKLFGAKLFKANLAGADLTGAKLFEADIAGANLAGANLFGADLFKANLAGADLTGANLFGADLFGADLAGAKLFEAVLAGADLTGADLARAKNLTIDQLSQVKTLYSVKGLDSTLGAQLRKKHPELFVKP